MNKHFKLKEAMKERKIDTGKFMSQKEFAMRLFPHHNPSTALYHVNMALNGHAFGQFSPDVIVRACKILKVEPNFLLNYKPKKQIK
jgi:hypothetical protein